MKSWAKWLASIADRRLALTGKSENANFLVMKLIWITNKTKIGGDTLFWQLKIER